MVSCYSLVGDPLVVLADPNGVSPSGTTAANQLLLLYVVILLDKSEVPGEVRASTSSN